MINNPEVTKIGGIEVLRAGQTGPNLLFFHDAGQTPPGFTGHISKLSEVAKVVAPNYYDAIALLQARGIQKPKPSDIIHFIAGLNLTDKNLPTIVLGLSLGALLAWAYAAERPNDNMVITTGSPLGWPLGRTTGTMIYRFIEQFIVKPQLETPVEIRKRDPGPGNFIRQFRKHPASVLHGLRMALTTDSRTELATINHPVDLLWGARDNYVPIWTGVLMSEILPRHPQVRIPSQWGHLWYNWEAEKVVAPAKQHAKDFALKR